MSIKDETSVITAEEYNELLKKLNTVESEKAKLARELRASENRNAIFKLNVETQSSLNETITKEKLKQEMYVRLLLESCPDIIFIIDEKMKFLLGTNSISDIISIDEAALLQGRELDSIIERYNPPAFTEEMIVSIKGIIENHDDSKIEKKLEITTENDKYEVDILSFHKDTGEFAGVLVIMHNITELFKAKDEAVHANRAKSDFLANMSHEIRTPMNAILGLLASIGQDPLTPRQQNFLFNIKRAANSLLTIINDILDFSKIEAGKLTLTPTNFDLHALLDNIETLVGIVAKEKDLCFSLVMSNDLPQFLFDDENRIRQLINNLVVNAIKYTQMGSVQLKAYVNDGKLRFDIIDTGIGIKADDIDKLFLPFEQLDLRKNKHVIGTGLGLAITKHICSAMKGRVFVESVYGKGATFSVELPLNIGTGTENYDDYEEFVFQSAPNAKVLVVDDIDINLIVVEAILNEYDITPDLATSGFKALDLIKEKQYEIIFMDQMMPDMDGIETTAKIREFDEYYSKVPVVALTANALSGAEKTLLESGFNDYLSKPIDVVLMNKCLGKWLKTNN